jgi:hypothetical protein
VRQHQDVFEERVDFEHFFFRDIGPSAHFDRFFQVLG